MDIKQATIAPIQKPLDGSGLRSFKRPALLGFAALAVAGYFLFRSNKKKKRRRK